VVGVERLELVDQLALGPELQVGFDPLAEHDETEPLELGTS
jgi:hypothetical protein